MKTVLEIKSLHKSFGDTQVLNDITFQVHAGEFVAIMGQSGSGKSTLLYCISGMDRPTSGSVFLGDRDISGLDDAQMSEVRLKEMGFIFQHSYLLKTLSIRDNIVLPGFRAGVMSRDQVNQRADTLMTKMGIDNVAHHDIKEVSGGQLQRAAICRALINEPKILFGDEPTGALNTSAKGEVMEIIDGVNAEGTTVIIVTHDANVAAKAGRVIYLRDGNIHAELTLGKYKCEEGEESQVRQCRDAGNHEAGDYETGEQAQLSREQRLSEWLVKQGF